LGLGLRYEIRLGGPIQLTGRAMRVWSERTRLDPTRPEAERNLGVESLPLYLADLGLTMNLTGRKSYRRLVPVINAGIGVASDLGEPRDPGGGFQFGTTFAFAFGAGVRWVPSGRLQLRIDVTDYLYQLSYPDSFRSAPAGITPILMATESTNEWTHNPVISVGVSYLFSR
jgi:hypothetical protein